MSGTEALAGAGDTVVITMGVALTALPSLPLLTRSCPVAHPSRQACREAGPGRPPRCGRVEWQWVRRPGGRAGWGEEREVNMPGPAKDLAPARRVQGGCRRP